MECSYLNLPAEWAVLRVQKVALCLAYARNPLGRGTLADFNFEQVAHLGGEVVEKKYFLACVAGQIGDLQSQITGEQEGGDGVLKVAAKFAAGVVESTLAGKFRSSGTVVAQNKEVMNKLEVVSL
jgi:hypothetical protein